MVLNTNTNLPADGHPSERKALSWSRLVPLNADRSNTTLRSEEQPSSAPASQSVSKVEPVKIASLNASSYNQQFPEGERRPQFKTPGSWDKTTQPAATRQLSQAKRFVLTRFIDPEGIAMIWLRDMARLWQQRTRLLGVMARALVWLFALGFGLRGSLGSIAGFSYEQFVFPGIIAMTVIFTGLQAAITIIQDREFGFLKEVQVAPTPRSTLVFGKCLGGASTATVQALTILIFAPFVSVTLTPLNVLATTVATLVTALAIASLGVVIAMWITSFENFGNMQNFVILPLYMFSGAIFPTRQVPAWLHAILFLNPLTYGVNAIRGTLLGYEMDSVPLNLAILLAFTVVMLIIATLMSHKEI